MATIVLARHGETDWNAEQRFQGHADPPLNEVGRSQATALADELEPAGIRAVYSSDLRRAAETAGIVAGRIGLPVVQKPALREIDVGEWSGLTVEEVIERFPDGYARHRDGGDGWTRGETHDELTQRIVAAVEEIASAHRRETVLVVTHGAALRALLAHVGGFPLAEFRRTSPSIGNGSTARIAFRDGVARRLD